jgi:multisubunit Na+/H+ antiporter MnhB subunit
MAAASSATDQSSVQLAYLLAADALLLLHVLFVAFVIVGLVMILLGGAFGWRWVRQPLFRWLHLVAIAVVVGQAWLGLVCPLTSWEMALRGRAGEAVYAGGFIAHWLEQLLYYRAPDWVFVLVYSLFGLLVLISWVLVRPRPWRRR